MVDFVEFSKDGETPMDAAPEVVDAPVVDVPVEAVSAEVEFEAAAADPVEVEHGTEEYWETTATEAGWKPDTDYTGDPDAFVGAKEYVQRGKLLAPLKEAIKSRDKDIDNIRRQTAAMIRDTQKQERVKYEGMLVQAQAAEDAAFDNADAKALRTARENVAQIQQGINQIDQTMQQPTQAPMPPEQGAAYESFMAENKSWYGVDEDKTAIAGDMGKGMAERLMAQKAQAGLATEITAEEYKGILTKVSAHFTAPGRPRVSSVQPASNSRPSKAARTGFDDLPSGDKAAFETMFKHGAFGKDKQKAQKRYATDYHDTSPYGAD